MLEYHFKIFIRKTVDSTFFRNLDFHFNLLKFIFDGLYLFQNVSERGALERSFAAGYITELIMILDPHAINVLGSPRICTGKVKIRTRQNIIKIYG